MGVVVDNRYVFKQANNFKVHEGGLAVYDGLTCVGAFAAGEWKDVSVEDRREKTEEAKRPKAAGF